MKNERGEMPPRETWEKHTSVFDRHLLKRAGRGVRPHPTHHEQGESWLSRYGVDVPATTESFLGPSSGKG